jgi:F-type H+-transporting ATPase subunit b
VNINATLIIQIIVFLMFVWFTKSFVVPPLKKALDERALKVQEGLAAADKAKADSAAAQKTLAEQLSTSRNETAQRLQEAERKGLGIVEEAKVKANEEAAKIIAAAKAEADQLANKAREALREQVAALAVKGAEQILRKEVNASVHADLLGRLKAEL